MIRVALYARYSSDAQRDASIGVRAARSTEAEFQTTQRGFRKATSVYGPLTGLDDQGKLKSVELIDTDPIVLRTKPK